MAGQAGYRCSVFMARFPSDITTNTAALRAHRWSIDWKVDDFDTTSFRNWGIGQYTGGLSDFDLSFDCIWWASDNPHNANNTSIGAGAVVSIRVMFGPPITLAAPNFAPVPTVPVPGYYFRRVLLTHVHTEAGVRDIIRYNFAGRVSVESEQDIALLSIPGWTNNFTGTGAFANYRFSFEAE